MRTHLLAASAVAVVMGLGLAVSTANAAPLGNAVSGITENVQTSAVEKTWWSRRCWWRHGHRHCTKVWVGPRRRW